MSTSILRNKPRTGLQGRTIYVYGEPGSGKTTFAAGFPSPVIVSLECGHEAFDVDVLLPKQSTDIVQSLNTAIASPDHKTVVVDSLTAWLDMASEAFEKSYGKRPELVEFGKGTTMVYSPIITALHNAARQCSQNNKCLVILTHATRKSVVNHRRRSVDSEVAIVPNINEKLTNSIAQYAGVIGAVLVGSKGDRFLCLASTAQTPHARARFPDSINVPGTIPLSFEALSELARPIEQQSQAKEIENA